MRTLENEQKELEFEIELKGEKPITLTITEARELRDFLIEFLKEKQKGAKR